MAFSNNIRGSLEMITKLRTLAYFHFLKRFYLFIWEIERERIKGIQNSESVWGGAAEEEGKADSLLTPEP